MKKYIVLFAGIIAMTGLVHAQAPASIAGVTLGVKITGGDGNVFATSGFYVTVIANDGNSFQSFADDETTEAGTFSSYAASGAIATAAFTLTSPAPIPGNVIYVFTDALSGTNSVTAPAVDGYQNGDFTMFTGSAPASIIGKSFHVSIREGGGAFATNGDFVLSIASSGNAYTITSVNGDGINSHGTYSYSQLNNSCGQIQLADSGGTGSTVYVGFTNATSGGYYLASTNGYQIGNITLLTAQAPASVAGVTFGVKITGGDGNVFATSGFYVLVAANDGNSFQSFADDQTTEAGDISSYTASGAIATAEFMLTSPAPIPGSIICVFTDAFSGINSAMAPDVGGYQNGDFIAFTNPVPTSIAGQDFYVSIHEGGGTFSTNDDFVLSIASSGNAYTITSVSGGGVNSQGTYSYSRLNNSCGQIQLADSDGTGSTVYVGFTNATSGGYYLASTNGYQIGSATLLTAQPVSSLVGNTVLAAVNSGTGPFATNGYFLFVPANSGDDYQLIGLAHVASSDGTYSYSTAGASGTMSLDDSENGPLDLHVFFSAPFQGNYAVSVEPYTQTGDVTGFTNPVPDSIAGEAFNITVTDGGAPFAASGSYVLTTAASGNTYTITGNGTSSHGIYSYSKVNSTCGGIALTDSVTGVSAAYLTLSNSISGVFAIAQPEAGAGYQIGPVTILPVLNLTQNGNEITISWTTNAAGFSLQSSTSLSPIAIWSAAPVPAIVGGNYVSTDVISGDAKFYRLKK